VPRPRLTSGDLELVQLFDQFEGRLVTPAGAATLLGLTPQTVHTLATRGTIRVLRGGSPRKQWTYIPLVDVRIYAIRTGRSTTGMDHWDHWLPIESV
jgi:hypothetical protein